MMVATEVASRLGKVRAAHCLVHTIVSATDPSSESTSNESVPSYARCRANSVAISIGLKSPTLIMSIRSMPVDCATLNCSHVLAKLMVLIHL